MLSFVSGSAIKRITAGVKASPLTVICGRFDLLAGPFTLPAKSDSNERILPYAASSDLISLDIGR
jgi:hypothetical protein